MSDNKIADATGFDALKGKLFDEFEKMTQMFQEEKSNFEKQMDRKREELNSEIKSKFSELAVGKKELANAKNEIEKKTLALKQMKEELEQEKKAHLKLIEEGHAKAKSIEVMKLHEVEAKTKALEIGNQELVKQKIAIEKDLKNMQQAYHEEKELYFQKINVFKNELEELEDEIEKKLFFAGEQEPPDYTRNTRELIITTVTGDSYRGNINIASKERLSDMFTKAKVPFIVMYDVTFKGEDKATVIINKQNIVSIKPLD